MHYVWKNPRKYTTLYIELPDISQECLVTLILQQPYGENNNTTIGNFLFTKPQNETEHHRDPI